MEIVEISYDAWVQMDPVVFKSAWISCGYCTNEDFPPNPAQPPITLEDARQALDVFGNLGSGTPQRCTACEWQVQDSIA